MSDDEKPRDAIILEKILDSMGIEKYEPRVIEQFLELIYRNHCLSLIYLINTGYVTDVLTDAQVYKEHSGRQDLDLEDVRLAIQSRVNYSFTEPPPEEFLLEVANAKNSKPLLIPENPCVMLPPEEHCLTATNYQITPV
jgi:transcription initiation factor TFIID subunit 9B